MGGFFLWLHWGVIGLLMLSIVLGVADRAINATLAAPPARRVTTAVVRVLFGAAVAGGLLWLLQ